MTPDAWITVAVLAATIVALVSERFPAAVVTLMAVITLFVTGVVDHFGAFGGLANPAPITIAALYVLAAGVETTGALSGLTERILGKDRPATSERRELVRICAPTAAASGLIANTPLVAMLAPRVEAWCRKTGRSASRYLMPLSYASVFGGVITVLGTSTNLTVNGLMTSAGMEPFGIFEFSAVGLAVAGSGVILLILVAPMLLPRRQGAGSRVNTIREFTIEMAVATGGPLDGATVEAGGLRHLRGVFLVEIQRRDHVIVPVAPDEILEPDDRLVFAGDIARIVDLQEMDGLTPVAQRHLAEPGAALRFFEAVVGPGLVGLNLREADFRNRYGAAVFAIHRAGERVGGKLGDVALRLGDVLVLVADRGFTRRWRDHDGLLLVSAFDASVPLRRQKAWIVQLTTLALVVSAAANIIDLTQAAILAAAALVVTGVLTVGEARDAIDLNTVLLVAFSFGLGEAVDASGLDTVLASATIDALDGFGKLGVLFGVLVATLLATELLSNNAAAILIFPIAVEVSSSAGVDIRAMAVAILIGASCSFLTPIGYQTNTLVYGMGGYRFSDFTRVGAPLTALAAIVATLTIPLVFPL